MRNARANFRAARHNRGFSTGRDKGKAKGRGNMKSFEASKGDSASAPPGAHMHQGAMPHLRCLDCSRLGHIRSSPPCPRPSFKGKGRGKPAKRTGKGKLKGLLASWALAVLAAGAAFFPPLELRRCRRFERQPSRVGRALQL